MTQAEAKKIIDKVVKDIFGVDNPYSVDEFAAKFAYDIHLPSETVDAFGEKAWVGILGAKKYIAWQSVEKREDWMYPKEEISSMDQLLNLWNRSNYWVSSHVMESENVAESDAVYRSANVFRSFDVRDSKNVVFCDSVGECEFVVASIRSGLCNYSIRLNESKKCASCFEVSNTGKGVNCMFVHDSYDVFECMFCSHLVGKKYCIANMQYTEEEYFKIKKMVVEWLFPAVK